MKRSLCLQAGLLLVGMFGLSLWVYGPGHAPVAWAQLNALARWDFNDDPLDPSNDGVEDVSEGDFPGDATPGVSQCSDHSMSPPRGTGDCIKLDEAEWVQGDIDESIFSANSNGRYVGDRTLMAWVKVASEGNDVLTGDRALISIGKADFNPSTTCNGDTGDDDCSEFILFLHNGVFP